MAINNVPRDTATLLLGMALQNATQAVRLIQNGEPMMAIWHLREATKQLEMATPDSPSGDAGQLIELQTPAQSDGN